MSQGVESSTGLRLNANNHPQPGTPEHAAMKAAWAKNKFHPKDPQRYSEFTSQLILRQVSSCPLPCGSRRNMPRPSPKHAEIAAGSRHVYMCVCAFME